MACAVSCRCSVAAMWARASAPVFSCIVPLCMTRSHGLPPDFLTVRCLQAFYKWLQDDFSADALVHVGMHGTVEWCTFNCRRRCWSTLCSHARLWW